MTHQAWMRSSCSQAVAGSAGASARAASISASSVRMPAAASAALSRASTAWTSLRQCGIHLVEAALGGDGSRSGPISRLRPWRCRARLSRRK